MHCPDCGTKASAGQKFCRACGFGLEKVEQMIADQRAAGADQSAEQTGVFSEGRLRNLKKWVARALFALGGVLGSLLLWAIIVEVMIEKGKIFDGAIIVLILVAAGLASFLAYLDSQRKKTTRAHLNQEQRLAPETVKTLPEPDLEMTASVAEHTTARLEEK